MYTTQIHPQPVNLSNLSTDLLSKLTFHFLHKPRNKASFPNQKVPLGIFVCLLRPLCFLDVVHDSWLLCSSFSFSLSQVQQNLGGGKTLDFSKWSKWLHFCNIVTLFISVYKLQTATIQYTICAPNSWVLGDRSGVFYSLSIPCKKQKSWYLEDSANIWREKRNRKQIYRNWTRINSAILQMNKDRAYGRCKC